MNKKFKAIPIDLDFIADMPNFEYLQDKIIISGHAKPEYAPLAWQSFIENLTNFLKIVNKITIDFKLDYYNSASNRFITEMFKILEANYKLKPIFNWFCFENDEDSIEDAETYKENYKKINLNIIIRDE